MRKHIPLLLILLSTVSAAQSNGVLVGIISMPDGEAVRDTRIALVELNTGVRYESRTDGLGIWAVSLLPAGEYRLDLQRRGLAVRTVGTTNLKAAEKKSWRVVVEPGVDQ
jgi:hypothetical protein